jgi:hypothetical protein
MERLSFPPLRSPHFRDMAEARHRQDPLPDELCERLLGLIVVDDRKVCLHLV